MRLMQSIATMAAQYKSGSDVKGQVKAMFADSLAALREPGTAIAELKRFPGVQAAKAVEEMLLQNIEYLVDQLQADGRRAMPAEVRRIIIETVRDLKLTSVEQDGNVNPIDSMAIQLKANGLKGRVRQQLLMARMVGKSQGTSIVDALNVVETKLLAGASQKFGKNWDELQREAQAVIYAIAELRLQQLVND